MNGGNNDDNGSRGDWISKQHQRVEESWKIHSPIIALGNLVMLIATLATLSWGLQLGIFTVVVLLVGMMFYLWLTGFAWDKTGYLQRRTSRRVQMTEAIPMFHQYKLAAALTAHVFCEALQIGIPNFNPEATAYAKEMVQNELEWFTGYATGTLSPDEQEIPEEMKTDN
jgi:hypothetical protein